MTTAIRLATEDLPSEEVGVRLIGEWPGSFSLAPSGRFRGDGFSNLKSNLGAFLTLAEKRPVLMLIDLDKSDCAPNLRADWLDGMRVPPHFIFRIAVRETEAWLLADHQGIRHFLGKRAAKALPDNPESLDDPKAALLQIARYAPSSIRKDMLREDDPSRLRRGYGYNEQLVHFIRTDWDPERACERSDSLRRARERLADLARRIGR